MMRELIWQNPIPNLVLLDDEIHLWRAELNLDSQHIEHLASILSEDEKLRADRLRFQQHRQRFMVARAILRQLLGKYLQISGDKINFIYNPQGKPQLETCFSKFNLEFNISHSKDLALYCFNLKQKIGIDLEYLRNNVDYQSIAQRFFCEREANLISNCTQQEQQKIFYQFWTAKEAYLKAIGEGLSGGLETLEIDIDRSGNIQLHSIKKEQKLTDDWLLYNFIPETNFIASIALSGQKKKLIPINYQLNSN